MKALLYHFSLRILLLGLIWGPATVARGAPRDPQSIPEAEKQILMQGWKALEQALQEAVATTAKGVPTLLDEALRKCADLMPALDRLYSSPEDWFGLGLFSAGTLANATDHATAASCLERFIPIVEAKNLNGVEEGLKLVLLQQYYHLKRWSDGAKLIESTRQKGIIAKAFVREAAGFSHGMVMNGSLTNEGIVVYSTVMADTNVAGMTSLPMGDSLMNLAHLCALGRDYNGQLKALERIEAVDTNYFNSNFVAIALSRFLGYKSLGDETNGMHSLVQAAKEYERNPKVVTDEAVREQLTARVKAYQRVGLLNDRLDIIWPQPQVRIQHPGRRILIWGIMFTVIFAPLAVFLRRQPAR